LDVGLHVLYARRTEVEVSQIQFSFQVIDLLDKAEADDSSFPEFSVRSENGLLFQQKTSVCKWRNTMRLPKH